MHEKVPQHTLQLANNKQKAKAKKVAYRQVPKIVSNWKYKAPQIYARVINEIHQSIKVCTLLISLRYVYYSLYKLLNKCIFITNQDYSNCNAKGRKLIYEWLHILKRPFKFRHNSILYVNTRCDDVIVFQYFCVGLFLFILFSEETVLNVICTVRLCFCCAEYY